MNIVNWWTERRLRKHPAAEECPICGLVAINETPFPFEICAEGHKTQAMLRINKS
jgi:hypothetical protein